MAMCSRHKLSFATRLLLSVTTLFLLFAIAFTVYQYHRERDMKEYIVDAQLREYCLDLVETIGTDSITAPTAIAHYLSTHRLNDLRLTIISTTGEVLYDSEAPDSLLPNHSTRREVASALRTGTGYTPKRQSTITTDTYFYSATTIGDIIVRAAVPHNATLTQALRPDYSFLIFAIILTILLGIVLYVNISRISRHVRFLQAFATEAARGTMPTVNDYHFPHDELGDACRTITALYERLHDSEEDKTRLKRQLTQNAAHELKTPAATIHGYLESILDNPEMSPEQQRHFLERCFAATQRMTHLLTDMTALMRLDESTSLLSHSPTTKTERVDIIALLRSLLDEVADDLATKGITPQLSLPATITIQGDYSLLYSIFRNIIDNTLSYATDATTITITAEDSGTYYSFSISDNGVGVTPEHLPHLFERFYRVDKGRSRLAGGTGLGLAIVKHAVQLHGGSATASTTAPHGLTIAFTLRKDL